MLALLPDELWEAILGHLPYEHWGRARRCCRMFYEITKPQVAAKQATSIYFVRFTRDHSLLTLPKASRLDRRLCEEQKFNLSPNGYFSSKLGALPGVHHGSLRTVSGVKRGQRIAMDLHIHVFTWLYVRSSYVSSLLFM